MTNGSIEISHYNSGPLDVFDPEHYDVSLFDTLGERYATYMSVSKEEEEFRVFCKLFKAVNDYLERIRRRKMALIYNELESPE